MKDSNEVIDRFDIGRKPLLLWAIWMFKNQIDDHVIEKDIPWMFWTSLRNLAIGKSPVSGESMKSEIGKAFCRARGRYVNANLLSFVENMR